MSDAFVLECPICGCSNVHHQGERMARGTSGKLVIDFTEAAHTKYGSIELPMICEQGCMFQLIIGSHKGDMLMWGKASEL
jgi:hypothetical protein